MIIVVGQRRRGRHAVASILAEQTVRYRNSVYVPDAVFVACQLTLRFTCEMVVILCGFIDYLSGRIFNGLHDEFARVRLELGKGQIVDACLRRQDS